MLGSRRNLRGFTLIELIMVIALITVLIAMAMPKLLPVIAASRLEGAARRTANYGRAVVAHATLNRERLIVSIDLDKQQYWTTRWLEGSGDLFDLDDETDKAPEDLPSAFEELEEPDEEQLARKAVDMHERFERLARLTTETRLKNLEENATDSLFADFEPLFDERFTLRDQESEAEAQELKDPLLQRTKLREGVEIESVRVGTKRHMQGTVEVEISPTGLMETVVFYLRGSAGDYYTVAWDPITGGAHLYEGKETTL